MSMDILATIRPEQIRDNPRAVDEAKANLIALGYSHSHLSLDYVKHEGVYMVCASPKDRPVCVHCGTKHNPANGCEVPPTRSQSDTGPDGLALASHGSKDAQPFRKYQPNNFQPFIAEGEPPRDMDMGGVQVDNLRSLGWIPDVPQPPHRAWVLIHQYSDGSGSLRAETTRVYLSEDRAKADMALVSSTGLGSEWHLLETQVYG